MSEVDAQHVVVTGAARGIGRAIAERLARGGCRVTVLDIDGDAAAAVAADLCATTSGCAGFAADITDYEAVREAIERAEETAGPLWGLVNNAGWDRAVRFVDSEPEFWRRVIDVNLYGPLNVTHVVAQKLADYGRGRIVSIASDAGRVGSMGESVYSAAKGGIIALMKSLARELAKQGITCNAVCPGPTDTQLLADLEESGRLAEALKKAIPMRRLGQPEDVAGIVTFLMSEEAAYITGQTISVSGGLTMQG